MLPVQHAIKKSLGQEPQQIKNLWYYWIKWTLTLPFRVISWPIRYLLMCIICPISRANDNTLKNFQFTKIDYQISSNDKCSMVFAKNQKIDNDITEKKLVINFGGNGETMSDRLSYLSDIRDISNDIIFVSYPKGATYSQELVDGGVSAVLHAINVGYKPENITIAGHSLGGAVSALVLQEMKNHLNQEQKFAGYINHRSFKDLGAFVAAHFGTSQDGLLRKAINVIAWAFRVQLDAESAIKSGLPVKKIVAYYDEQDGVIKSAASIGKAIEDSGLQPGIKTEVVRTNVVGYTNNPNGIFAHCALQARTLYGGEESIDYQEYVIAARTEIAAANQI